MVLLLMIFNLLQILLSILAILMLNQILIFQLGYIILLKDLISKTDAYLVTAKIFNLFVHYLTNLLLCPKPSFCL